MDSPASAEKLADRTVVRISVRSSPDRQGRQYFESAPSLRACTFLGSLLNSHSGLQGFGASCRRARKPFFKRRLLEHSFETVGVQDSLVLHRSTSSSDYHLCVNTRRLESA